MSLRGYALTCVNVLANLPKALDSVLEAIDLYVPLMRRLPQMFAARMFAAYRTLADVLDGLGSAEEAADVRRRLDEMHWRADQTTSSEPEAG